MKNQNKFVWFILAPFFSLLAELNFLLKVSFFNNLQCFFIQLDLCLVRFQPHEILMYSSVAKYASPIFNLQLYLTFFFHRLIIHSYEVFVIFRRSSLLSSTNLGEALFDDTAVHLLSPVAQVFSATIHSPTRDQVRGLRDSLGARFTLVSGIVCIYFNYCQKHQSLRKIIRNIVVHPLNK